MVRKGIWTRMGMLFVVFSLLMSFSPASSTAAQEPGPVMRHPKLDVRTVISGLVTPTSLAFLGLDEFFVIEKNTGKVLHVVDEAVQNTALDLAVNNSSERGLLGIALDPDFASNNYVYLYWTCKAPAPTDPFTPSMETCTDTPELGDDTDDILAVPLLGNRIDRFVWDGENLTFDINLIMLRAFQNDAAPTPPDQGDEDQPPAGNHNGGVLRFGADGKLYVMVGDVGRRGQLQNLPSGPTETGLGPTVPDDQFGGPEPDNAHFTGVILRLNTDGTAPDDNPFFAAGASMGGEVGTNIQKIFAYGIRNSFGMAVDPITGNLWASENGEDAFDEINLVEPGMNSGWIQIMGPAARVPLYRKIETTEAHDEDFPNLQQFRWGPERIARTSEEALSRLFVLPGSHFSDPVLTWKYVVPPAAMGFMSSMALGQAFYGDLFSGNAEDEEELLGGLLLRFNLIRERTDILGRRVINNRTFDDLTGTKRYIIGEGFGILTDIETAPNGNLYVVSLTHGAVYEVFRKDANLHDQEFSTELSGEAEVPGPGDPDASGTANLTLNLFKRQVCFELTVSNMAPATASHIHVGTPDVAGPVVVPLVPPPTDGSSAGCINNVDRMLLRNIIRHPENYYVNVHNADFPAGAARGQLSE